MDAHAGSYGICENELRHPDFSVASTNAALVGGHATAAAFGAEPDDSDRLGFHHCYVDTMNDLSVSAEIAAFVAERDWAQFHSPENLAKSIAIEAGELLECFQWNADADDAQVRGELADVLTYCLMLADRIGVDPNRIILDKLAVTRQKYPVDKARGSSAKYDEL